MHGIYTKTPLLGILTQPPARPMPRCHGGSRQSFLKPNTGSSFDGVFLVQKFDLLIFSLPWVSKKVSWCVPAWSGENSPPVSASWVLRLAVSAAIPNLLVFIMLSPALWSAVGFCLESFKARKLQIKQSVFTYPQGGDIYSWSWASTLSGIFLRVVLATSHLSRVCELNLACLINGYCKALFMSPLPQVVRGRCGTRPASIWSGQKDEHASSWDAPLTSSDPCVLCHVIPPV